MRTVEILGRRLELQGSPYTLLVFREEFGGDLFAHLNDVARSETVDIEGYLRVIWAMNATVTDKAGCYAEWLRAFDAGEFSIEEGVGCVPVMDSAIAAEMFRGRKTGIIARLKRQLSRLLGSLSGRLGA
ncbi:MAG: hypothetical protein IJF97_00785 [Eggerthellaceae bacterium]|nr:hypothetical protein [Eggerthellaceae bacterium]MBQ3342672.1 hypothetical protein [Kiritimatiellia bacterium]MBQ9621579.1 hypothetical protein [Atopobiaceae bacterium]